MWNKRIMSCVLTSVFGMTTIFGGVFHPTFTGSFFEVNADEENDDVGTEDTDEYTEDEESDGFSYSESVAGYKISIEAASGVFPEGTTVSIKQVENPVSLIEDELPEGRNIEKIATFDIGFWNDGTEIEPEDDSVDISISLNSDMKKVLKDESAAIQVFHIEDGSVEEVDSSTDGKEVSFSADSFSYYAVVASSGMLDTTPPTITGLSLSATSVTAPGKIEVTATATDDISGVNEAWVVFYNNTYNDVGVTTPV